MNTIPPGVDPAEWLVHRVRRKYLPQTIGRMVVAVAVAALVKKRVVRAVMALSLVLDIGLLAWMRVVARRLLPAALPPPSAEQRRSGRCSPAGRWPASPGPPACSPGPLPAQKTAPTLVPQPERSPS